MSGFIQITDTHIVAPGALAYGVSDTAAALRRAVAMINARLPEWGAVECAIVTGDLTDHGTPEEYAHFAEIMADLALPWRALPGNHDRRAAMRAAFDGATWMPSDGPIQWVHDLGPYAVIGLDTLTEPHHHGALCPVGFSFAERALRELGEKPAVIATHHPWMASGIPAMDADNLRNGAPLMALLAAHRGGARMISGHVHRAMSGQVGPVPCQIAPATCHAVHSDHGKGRPPMLTLEAGAVSLYQWQGASGGLVSDVIPIGTFEGPYPFEG